MTNYPVFQTIEEVNRYRQSDQPLFDLGRVVATPAALKALEAAGLNPFWLVEQHRHGQWGDLCPSDKAMNDQALLDGSRILSAYALATEQRLYVITEAVSDGVDANTAGRRESTCVLCVEEY